MGCDGGTREVEAWAMHFLARTLSRERVLCSLLPKPVHSQAVLESESEDELEAAYAKVSSHPPSCSPLVSSPFVLPSGLILFRAPLW